LERIASQAQQAEVASHQAEAKAQQAEVASHQAEAKAQQAKVAAHQAEAKAQQAEVASHQAEAKAQQAEVAAHQAEAASTQHMAQLHAVYASRSWRITSPLRWIVKQVRMLRSAGLHSRFKALVKKTLRKVNYELLRRPAFRLRLLRWSHKFGLYGWLKALQAKVQVDTNSIFIQGDASTPTQTNLEDLSPRAQQIYADLKDAIQLHQKGHN
jgi:multidrug efflux pump subunit AcrA (membrane-fusion protein)